MLIFVAKKSVTYFLFAGHMVEGVKRMFRQIKKRCQPALILMIVGFAISFTSIMLGISTISVLLKQLANSDPDTPIYWTMQNTGLSLAIAIYLFSIANCLVVSNYCIIAKSYELAIRKSFGFSNGQLILLVGKQMLGILLISLVLSNIALLLVDKYASDIFTVRFSPLLLFGTLLVLMLTLLIAMALPIRRILKIKPVEVIG